MTRRRRLYLLAGSIVGPMAVVALRLYTRLTKRPRVRVLVTNEKGEVLLVKGVISTSKKWTFPGGGVGRGESLEDATRRELHEETGINIANKRIRHMRTVPMAELDLHFDAPVFHVEVNQNDLPDVPHNPKEIAHIGWFDAKNVPEHTSRIVRKILAEYHAEKQ